MKGISTDPRVLLVTPYRRFRSDYLNIIGMSIYNRFPRADAPLRVSPALRFIKQNVPRVEILEYPLWQEYVEKLKQGWDVVGFSFYQYQIPQTIEMINQARRQGVDEVWVGGYGVLNTEIQGYADRVVRGPGEDFVARAFGRRVRETEIRHPAMLVHFSILPGLRYMTFGLLYTTHGCPYRCRFCQTPAFEPRCFTVNLDSIRKVVAYYHKMGIREVVMLDETFGAHPGFADELTRLFARYRMRWFTETRMSLVLKNLDAWYERGLRLTITGAEAMDQRALDKVHKRQKVEDIEEFARRTGNKPGLFRIVTYMLGHEHMDAEETIADAERLKKLGFEVAGVTVLTPFPGTPYWDEIDERYGIFEKDFSRYDNKHLVWNHPYISRAQMEYLLKGLKARLNRPSRVYRRGIKRMFLNELRQQGTGFLTRNLIKGPLTSLKLDDREFADLSP